VVKLDRLVIQGPKLTIRDTPQAIVQTAPQVPPFQRYSTTRIDRILRRPDSQQTLHMQALRRLFFFADMWTHEDLTTPVCKM
jgi:hypothetical protein